MTENLRVRQSVCVDAGHNRAIFLPDGIQLSGYWDGELVRVFLWTPNARELALQILAQLGSSPSPDEPKLPIGGFQY